MTAALVSVGLQYLRGVGVLDSLQPLEVRFSLFSRSSSFLSSIDSDCVPEQGDYPAEGRYLLPELQR